MKTEYITDNKNSAFEYLQKFQNCLLKFVQVFLDPLKEKSASKMYNTDTAFDFWTDKSRHP